MENKTIDVKTLTDLELMKYSVDLNMELQQKGNQLSIILTEYNRRVEESEKIKSQSTDPNVGIQEAQIIK